MRITKYLVGVAGLAAITVGWLSIPAYGDDPQPVKIAPAGAGGPGGWVAVENSPENVERMKPFIAVAAVYNLITEIKELNMRPDFNLTADQKKQIIDIRADFDKAHKADNTIKADDYLAKLNAVLTPEQVKIKAEVDAKAAAAREAAAKAAQEKAREKAEEKENH